MGQGRQSKSWMDGGVVPGGVGQGRVGGSATKWGSFQEGNTEGLALAYVGAEAAGAQERERQAAGGGAVHPSAQGSTGLRHNSARKHARLSGHRRRQRPLTPGCLSAGWPATSRGPPLQRGRGIGGL